MKFKFIFVLIAALAAEGCLSGTPEVLLKKDFDGNGIAVLNFSRQGNSLSNDIGRIAADKLTDAFFLAGQFNVVDRAKVNEAQANLEINSEFLSEDEIQKIGLRLKANYLVLGRIQQVSETEYLNMDSEKELYVSFRIISVLNSELVGVASASETYNGNIVEKIDRMMTDIVKAMVGSD